MTEAYKFGESLSAELSKALKKETIPKGVCKCRLLFAKAGQVDIWVYLTWGGYAELAGIGDVHNSKVSFEVSTDGESYVAFPCSHQEEPFSITGLLVPATCDYGLWKKLFGCGDKPSMKVHLSGSTIKTIIELHEGSYDIEG
jgi:hypothetical protein